jgi:Domain of unknown function (DUF4832)
MSVKPERGFYLAVKNNLDGLRESDVTAAYDSGYRLISTHNAMLAPFGGETCNPADEKGATPRTTCADIETEGARYALTYLNDEYYRPLFHDRWIAHGCMTGVRQKMGYRIALLRLSLPGDSVAGATIKIDFTVRNSGWARIYNPRGVRLYLRNISAKNVFRIACSGADPRGWLPGKDTDVHAACILPHTLQTGHYSMLIAFPDGDQRLANDPRYTVRVANADDPVKRQYWDRNLGAFETGTSLRIE